jgi:putative transposase
MSDAGPDRCATVVCGWLQWLEVRALFIEPGSPWENGYSESFHGKLRDELLDRDIFSTRQDARILIEGWRQRSTTVRPHCALGDRPPAPEAVALPPLSLPSRVALQLE